MLVKAFLAKKDSPAVFVPFLFNPNELTVERTNQFTEIDVPGLGSSILQFVKGNSRTLTMDLFFDTYEMGTDVRLFTDLITGWDAGSMLSGLPIQPRGLMDIDPEEHAPPPCLFIWGLFIFPCVIQSVTKKFTMFLPEGIPVRATLSITLKEYKDYETQLKETIRHSSDRSKTRLVKEGDSLWLIAAREYGDPLFWRHIAQENDIDNPRQLVPGMELTVPPLERADDI